MKKLQRLLPSNSKIETTWIMMKLVAFLRSTSSGKNASTSYTKMLAKKVIHRGRVLNVNTPTIKRNVEAI